MTVIRSPSLLRLASLRTVFTAMLGHGAISRAQLSRITGLSKQTVSDVTQHLEQDGWIRQQGQTQGMVGRSATNFVINERNAFVAGIDLGGTKVHVALADLKGHVLAESAEMTDRRGGHHVIEQIRTMVGSLIREGAVTAARIQGGVLGSPGVFDRNTGKIRFAPNIPDFDSFDVASAFRKSLGFELCIENDVNLAALGERRQSARSNVENLAFIALGTGIGMGIVANGQLLRGAHGAAGEIAYLPIGGDPFDSRGYVLGTLESAIGSNAIRERFAAQGGNPSLDVRAIFDQLEDGPAAAIVIDEIARLLFQTIMAVRAVLDPDLIVLGGGIGSRQELIERVQVLDTRIVAGRCPVEISLLGSRAVLTGAVGLAVDMLQRTLFADPAFGN